MVRCLFLLALCLFGHIVSAQQSDFLSLRRKGRTMKTFVPGSPIEFITRSGNYITGTVKRIINDSIYITQYDVRMRATYWGTGVKDTITKYDLRFNYKDISAIPRPPKSFEFIRNGLLPMIGGLGYGGLHTINSWIQKDAPQSQTLYLCAGVAATGFLMKKLRKYYLPIGKKYTLEYVSLTNTKTS